MPSMDFIGSTDFSITAGNDCNSASLNLRLVCSSESTLIASFSARCASASARPFLRVASANSTIAAACISAASFSAFARTVSSTALVSASCAAAIRATCLARSASAVWRVVSTFCWALTASASARLARASACDCCSDLAAIAIDFVWLAISVTCCCSISLMRTSRSASTFLERTACSRSISVS